jgi:ABC-type Fe3+-hydroxamate transport system substrate-binding protein
MKRLLLFSSFVALCTLPCFAGRTLTEEMGRCVVAPDHPHLIICLMPSVTDTVFALGAGDELLILDFCVDR